MVTFNLSHEECIILRRALSNWDGWINSERRSANSKEEDLRYGLLKKIPKIPE